MGTTLHFSTTFYPQTDEQSERIIQILENMLRACVLDFKLDWERYLSLIEFFYKNSFQKIIEIRLTRPCMVGSVGNRCWIEVGEQKLFGPKLVQLTTNKIKIV